MTARTLPCGPDGPAVPIETVERTPSTQDLAARRLAEGRPAPFAVLAAAQSAARGRLGRSFSSPPGSSLALTLAHRSALAPGDRSWFPLAVGTAALAALSALPGAERLATHGLGLKWPNDLHTADGGKLGGILVEGRGAHDVLLGIGLNLAGPVRAADGGPLPHAVWLHGPGGLLEEEVPPADELVRLRDALAAGIARGLAAELAALEAAGGDGTATGLHERFSMSCVTLGQEVRVDPLGADGPRPQDPIVGTARGIDDRGRLLLALRSGGTASVDVGDVHHLRAVGASGGTMDDRHRPGAGGEEESTR